MEKKKTFNLYCDESCHLENDGKPYMLLGYVNCAYPQVRLHTDHIKELKKQHRYAGEIKWTKVSHKQYGFYADLIDYFFATELSFRAVVVPKNRINNASFEQTYDTFYYKMYWQLLHHKMSMENNYNIYLDVKDTLSAKKVGILKEILRIDYSAIRNLQNIRSHESMLMQLADVLMGAIAYLNNQPDGKVKAKTRLIEKISAHSSHPLTHSTRKDLDKFNLFFIELK